jgi:hypothetical protein
MGTSITQQPTAMTHSEFIEFVKELGERTKYVVSLTGIGLEMKVLIDPEITSSGDNFEA